MVSFYLLLAMHVYSLYDKYWVLMMYAFHLVNNTFNKKNFKYLKNDTFVVVVMKDKVEFKVIFSSIF